MAYVDKEKLILDVQRNLIPGTDAYGEVSVQQAERYFLSLIDKHTAVDVEKVRHGKWIKCQRLYGIGYEYICSVCEKGTRQYEGQPRCSECGAIMDGGDERG